MSLISIVIPAHNSERFLAATLESVLAQSHEDWECVIVDDGSDDGTLAVAEQYCERDGRIRALHVEQGGASAARNAGFRASNEAADYCTFLDSDDVWVADALRLLLRGIEPNVRAIGAHGVAEFIDETGATIEPGVFSARGRHRLGVVGRRIIEVPQDQPTDFSVLLFGTSIFPPALALIERRAYVKAGPFDESLKAGEDWEMTIRLSRLGPIVFVPDVIAHYRRHEDNAGAKHTAPAEVHRALCQSFHSPLNTRDQRTVARRGWRARQRERMAEVLSEVWSLRSGSPRTSAALLAQGGAAAGRYLQGGPRPVIRKHPPTW